MQNISLVLRETCQQGTRDEEYGGAIFRIRLFYRVVYGYDEREQSVYTRENLLTYTTEMMQQSFVVGSINFSKFSLFYFNSFKSFGHERRRLWWCNFENPFVSSCRLWLR